MYKLCDSITFHNREKSDTKQTIEMSVHQMKTKLLLV